jgi:hypothetical protein
MNNEHLPLEDLNPTTFEHLHHELARVLNTYGVDALLSTPDHVLATMLIQTLDNYGEAQATTKRLAKGGPMEHGRRVEERALSMDFNQHPVTTTYQPGGCRGPITIVQQSGHGGFPESPELGDKTTPS